MSRNLIIGGVHKAGTTSLFRYLKDHPDICGASKKETHFFTPLRYGRHTEGMDVYNAYFDHCSLGIKYLLEASPSYLYGSSRVADEISSKLNRTRIIFILRNPSDRFISYYKHCESKSYIERGTTFEQFFDKNRENFSKMDLDDPFYRGLKEGNYYDYLTSWLNKSDLDVRIVFFDDLVSSPRVVLREICEWLNLSGEIYKGYSFTVENKTRRYKYYRLHRLLLKMYRYLESFFEKYHSIKSVVRKIYTSLNKNEEVKIEASMKMTLDRFYSPLNKKLRLLLVDRGYDSLPDWLNESDGKN